MNSDHRWQSWFTALADPNRSLVIINCRRYRSHAWDLGRRCLTEHMLHVIEEGGQIGVVGGKNIETEAGSVLWVPAGTVQHLRHRPERGRLTITNLRFSLAKAEPPPIPFVIRRALGAGDRLADVRVEWAAHLLGRELRLRSMLVLLFSELWRVPQRPTGGLDPVIQDRVLRLIEKDSTLRLAPEHLAAAVDMSPNWFSRLFRRTYGVSPRSWMVRHRMQQASEHLNRETPVQEVAAQFGYQDSFLFSRQFKAVMGMSPRAWMRRNGA
ncbi:MAG: AraC family transcriptional regulator [Planctomycetota bacterium]